jgi:hypothetical protein
MARRCGSIAVSIWTYRGIAMRRLILLSSLFIGAATITAVSVAGVRHFTGTSDASPTGGVVTLTPQEVAAQDRASALQNAGPLHVTCAGRGTYSECSQLPDNAVIAALKNGVAIYQRKVRFGIPQSSVDRRLPILASDELRCAAPASGPLHCVSVSADAPALTNGAVVTYSPLNVRFAGSVPVVKVSAPSVP